MRMVRLFGSKIANQVNQSPEMELRLACLRVSNPGGSVCRLLWPAVCSHAFLICVPQLLQDTSHLVDPASSHMLVSKIKPCMSQYKLLYSETANGSL
jgi:hypothetical protein